MDSCGMTQIQLAAAAGCDQSAISGYLKGRIPSGDKLVALARALGCSAEALLEESSTIRETPSNGYGERVKKNAAQALRQAAKKLREEAGKLESQADLISPL